MYLEYFLFFNIFVYNVLWKIFSFDIVMIRIIILRRGFMSKKTVEYLNLNITFNGYPLLSRFEDIFMPAISENYLKLKSFKYVFKNLEIRKIDGEYVLIGIVIKDTILEVNTVLDENKDKLIDRSDKIKSSPYSIFVLFLKDHRMLLVKNQKGSPNISNLKTAFKDNLSKYIRDKNKIIKKKIRKELKNQKLSSEEMKERFDVLFSKKRLPYPKVDIIGITSKDEIEKILKNSKIQNVKFKFAPRNHDLGGYSNLFDSINDKIVNNCKAQATLNLEHPENKDEVVNIMNETEDLVDTSITVKKLDGSIETITPEKYIKKSEVEFTNETRNEQINEFLSKLKFLSLKRKHDSNSEYDAYIDMIKRVKEEYGRD